MVKQETVTAKRGYTVAEAAQYLGVGATMVREYIADGRLRCVRLNQRVVVPKEELDALLDGAEKAPTLAGA